MVVIVLRINFTVMYKLDETHVIIDSLSRLPNITEPTSVLHQTIYASLFYAEP
jgi:hypothetical protein